MKDPIEISCEKRRQTDKGLLIYDGRREVWLPKSQVKIVEERGAQLELKVPGWLAKDKGLI